MIKSIIEKIIGSQSERRFKALMPLVAKINQCEAELSEKTIEELKAKTMIWKKELEKKDWAAQEQRLNEILPEAFAVVKSAARKLAGTTVNVCGHESTWDMVHFDVQMLAGIVLHQGGIAEMGTGEGKTLAATLPLYLNALTGRGVHLVTANEYLAQRDAEWMGHLLGSLGITSGVIAGEQSIAHRQDQYRMDITYGTSNDFGFDYLRDNGLAIRPEHRVQRGHFFAIVDEADSILIDEARTPLIISGEDASATHNYHSLKPAVKKLVERQSELLNKIATTIRNKAESGRDMLKVKLGNPKHPALLSLQEDAELRAVLDNAELVFYRTHTKGELSRLKEELYYTIDEKTQDAELTELGRKFLSNEGCGTLILPDITTQLAGATGEDEQIQLQENYNKEAENIHNIIQLLKAYCLYANDVEYVVDSGAIIIIDQSTGRKMPGRRWGEGLHQAIEVKEGMSIQHETKTLATITIQNYFRMYEKLAGMTGTAETDAHELLDTYNLTVVPIPPNKPLKRKDNNDRIFKTKYRRDEAVVSVIQEAYGRKQPVLVGTASVNASELLGKYLQELQIPHTILNAKSHGREAEIIAMAGMPGAVTISTNMAGRGTDIKLGQGVAELGGLLVIGTERYESRRVDRQLRGRAARQGDPGESIFFISFEDNLMRTFGVGEKMTGIYKALGREDSELSHPWLTRTVETAQKRVEQRNCQIRKYTLEYDDVMSQQREVLYGLRNDIIDGIIEDLVAESVVAAAVKQAIANLADGTDINYATVCHELQIQSNIKIEINRAEFPDNDEKIDLKLLQEVVRKTLFEKFTKEVGVKLLTQYAIIRTIDRLWEDHLYAMDGLREYASLHRYAQKNPIIEYKNDAFAMFTELMELIKEETAKILTVRKPEAVG